MIVVRCFYKLKVCAEFEHMTRYMYYKRLRSTVKDQGRSMKTSPGRQIIALLEDNQDR